MIGFAEESDLSGLTALFLECFPGDEEFSSWFFKTVWQPENTLVYRQGAEIEAMLYLLPVTLSGGEKATEGEYVYAVGTKIAARGKGYAAALLKHAYQETQRRGKSFLVLIPAQTSLFDYYSRFGYQAAFYMKETEIQAQKSDDLMEKGAEKSVKIADFYEKNMQNRTHIQRNEIEMKRQTELFGSQNVYYFEKDQQLTAYAMAEYHEGKWRLAECIGEEAARLAAAVAAEKGQSSIVMRGPADTRTNPFAMICECGSKISFAEMLPAYANLLYN